MFKTQKFSEEWNFVKLVQEELSSMKDILWSVSGDITKEELDDYIKSKERNLRALIENKEIQGQLNSLIQSAPDISETSLQDSIEKELVYSFRHISEAYDKNTGLDLNIFLMNYDFDMYACHYGFSDESYEFKILSGEESLEYDYNRELFYAVEGIDFTNYMQLILQYEDEVGDDLVKIINDSTGEISYLTEIKQLYLLNAYLGVHLCLDKIGDNLRSLDIPMMEEVYLFACEHDWYMSNLYVL